MSYAEHADAIATLVAHGWQLRGEWIYDPCGERYVATFARPRHMKLALEVLARDEAAARAAEAAR
jgi:hypothetical protein